MSIRMLHKIMKKSIAVSVIVARAIEDYASSKFWAQAEHYENAHEAYAKAEACLEIVEVDLCGQRGGHDTNQPKARTLADRIDWICFKYNLDHLLPD